MPFEPSVPMRRDHGLSHCGGERQDGRNDREDADEDEGGEDESVHWCSSSSCRFGAVLSSCPMAAGGAVSGRTRVNQGERLRRLAALSKGTAGAGFRSYLARHQQE
jgi:hypothetical protein